MSAPAAPAAPAADTPGFLARFNPWRGLAGLPGRLWLLFAATLVNRAGTMVLPFLAIYLIRARGFSAPGAGAMLGVYGATAIATSPVSGRLSDRFGPLPVMVGGLFTAGAVLLAYPWARSVGAVALATVAFAVGNEMFRPASLTAVSSWLPREQLRMGFVLTRLAVNLGMSVGPAVGGFLAARSFGSLFVADALTSLAAGTLILAAIPRLRRAGLAAVGRAGQPASGRGDRPPASPVTVQAPEDVDAGDLTGETSVDLVGGEAAGGEATPASGARSPGILGDRTFLFFLAGITVVLLVFFQHASTMALFLVQTLGLSPAIYGLLFTLSTAQIVVLEVPLNGAMRDWPLRRSLGLGALLSAAGFGAFGLVHGVWGAAAAVVTFTFGEMILFPSASAYASHRAPADRLGAYMGAYSMAAALAFAIGPWLGTAVYARFGPGALWAGCFVVAALGAWMLTRVAEAPAAPAAGTGSELSRRET